MLNITNSGLLRVFKFAVILGMYVHLQIWALRMQLFNGIENSLRQRSKIVIGICKKGDKNTFQQILIVGSGL